ncbi:exosortase Y-associated Wzy-like protein [Paradesertivirga mongoliensis]|uniref:Exosortase Y-associated Wzy-like protein n=1 Tax=Paradesertivirga mongoliensis TaxID=2100740 RepID=A0ABW4ZG92_9SPHI|nr:hypothetical protein [Pedobacter mongoliensis]
MQDPRLIERYLLLYIPWLLSLAFAYLPVLSFFVAWLGSFYIFYLTYSGRIKELPTDLPIAEQLMRPIFLVHVIFAGYMSVSPIFNLLDALGWISFDDNDFPSSLEQLELISQSQRYYCLGHAAYATGLLVYLKTRNEQFKVVITDLPSFLVRFTVVALIASNAFLFIPGLKQFYFQLTALSFIGATLALVFSFKADRIEYVAICGVLFIINLIQSLRSGFKEPVIINMLVLGIFLYPFYKKLVLAVFIPLMLVLFFLLPTYNQVFREKAWTKEEDVEQASEAAMAALQAEDDGQQTTTTAWGFLTGRLSEVQMFTGYIENTPSKNEFYGFTILWQSLEVIIPRAIWPSKPSTEELVMERVYQAGVINRGSSVSAKPALIVDGYLSGGVAGIFLTCLIFGAFTQIISIKAEELFGDYIIGTALVYSGLFQILWRGLSFEFLINSVVWSYITMYIIFLILRLLNVLKKVDELHSNIDETYSD